MIRRNLGYEINSVSESSYRMTTNSPGPPHYHETPDGRYFVVRGCLWRKNNPALDEDERDRLVKELMSARRAVRDAKADSVAVADARKRANQAKIALGERGPVWWDNGEPDYNRHMAKNTPYADWYAAL